MNNEIWKDVIGYERRFQVSSLGRIRHTKTKKIKICKEKYDGYVSMSFQLEGTRKRKYVHRLVAETFIGVPNTPLEVNHKNGIKNDNRLENLEWVTKSENCKHRSSFESHIPKLVREIVNTLNELGYDIVKRPTE
jgi:hypothetical protein